MKMVIDDPEFDREKILITVQKKTTCMVAGSLADGRSSFGIVAEQDFFEKYGYDSSADYDLEALQKRILADDASLSHVLRHAKHDTPVRTLVGYSADVKHLASNNYALLGNAGEFLDPVFSSGVTIALKSSSLAVPLVEQVLQGQTVDWMEQYEKPLRKGIQVFQPMSNHGIG
jgi:flavin-dependent dehydrogenase